MIIFCGGKQNMILLILLVDKIFLNICTVWREKKTTWLPKLFSLLTQQVLGSSWEIWGLALS